MTGRLRRGDAITASIVVACPPELVYEVIADITRIPEWSPECVRSEWLDEQTFRGWNRRGAGRWSTTARVESARPGEEFAFVVQAMGGDFTRWSYRMVPGERHGTTLLTEEVRMCVDLPVAALLFEWIALRVRDRQADLMWNLETSLAGLRDLCEGASTVAQVPAPDQP